MNPILRNGFVRPIINFNFAGGTKTIDTAPPTCFMSFSQNRTVRQANTFELTLLYVPGTYGESEATAMHQLLLSSVNQPVEYQYGYIVPGGRPVWQNQRYVGIFTKYFENIEQGWFTYKICGVSKSVELDSPKVKPSEIIKTLRKTDKIKPSEVLRRCIHGAETGFSKYFDNFNLNIEFTDEEIDPMEFDTIQDGPLMEVLRGSYNADGSKSVGGFCDLSVMEFEPSQSISSKTLSGVSAASTAAARSAAGLTNSGLSDSESVIKMPFICYFDNVASGGKDGTFYYVPSFDKPVSNTFTFEYGNVFLESDVLSFNADVDCTVAMATVGGTTLTSNDIDVDGNAIGANYNLMQPNGYVPDSYTTISGFNQAAKLSEHTIAEALAFPFEATMTVLGQTDCNQLLDKINVQVTFNGVPHPGLSGKYVILDIQDELSDSGFTTTFRLLRDYDGSNSAKLEILKTKLSTNGSRLDANASKAWTVEQGLKNDYNTEK